jgi:hypothetical protein
VVSAGHEQQAWPVVPRIGADYQAALAGGMRGQLVDAVEIQRVGAGGKRREQRVGIHGAAILGAAELSENFIFHMIG